MDIKVIAGDFAICKVTDFSQVNWDSPYLDHFGRCWNRYFCHFNL